MYHPKLPRGHKRVQGKKGVCPWCKGPTLVVHIDPVKDIKIVECWGNCCSYKDPPDKFKKMFEGETFIVFDNNDKKTIAESNQEHIDAYVGYISAG